MKPQLLQTYSIRQPIATHFRPATCEEADCGAFLNGWSSEIDDRTELGQGQAVYIREQSGRRFEVHRVANGNLLFTFEAGQRCFGGQHQVSLERPAVFAVRGASSRIHTRPEDWVEDFSEHLDQVRKDRE